MSVSKKLSIVNFGGREYQVNSSNANFYILISSNIGSNRVHIEIDMRFSAD